MNSVERSLSDTKLHEALKRANDYFDKARKKALEKIPNLDELKNKARKIKEDSIAQLAQLIKQLKDNIEEQGAQLHQAKDAIEFNDIITRICTEHDAELVVKGKSMVSEETDLNKALKLKGIEVVETDLGEWILQLNGDSPSHPVVPAIHKTREDIAAIFSKYTGHSVSADPKLLAGVARRVLREKFIKAQIGITGANLVAADTGTLVVVENEGNVRFASNAPPVHVCGTSIEKVIRSFDDIMPILRLLPPNATGQIMTCYVNFITGPSKTADIELQTVTGVHGPQELHLVLLDNGRSRLIADPKFKEAAYCIKCGACLNICPAYQKLGGHTMGYKYAGGIGAIWTSFLHGLEKSATFVYTCTLCGACKEVCPLQINIPRMVKGIRSKLVK